MRIAWLYCTLVFIRSQPKQKIVRSATKRPGSTEYDFLRGIYTDIFRRRYASDDVTNDVKLTIAIGGVLK